MRQLAADLALAAGTVARTYRELEAAGVVTTRRGAGTRVAASAPGPASVGLAAEPSPAPASGSPSVTGAATAGTDVSGDPARGRLEAMARDLVAHARAIGASDADVTAAVREALRRTPLAPSRDAVSAGPSRAAASRSTRSGTPRWQARPAGRARSAGCSPFGSVAAPALLTRG